MRRIALLCAFLIALLATAQAQTTVSATVTDSDGIAWAGGSYYITYMLPINSPGPLTNTLTGAVVIAGSFKGSLDNTGSFSVSLVPSANLVAPNGAGISPGVLIAVCPKMIWAQCASTSLVSISGATQSVSAQITAAISAPRWSGPLTGNVQAYADVEIPGSSGATYFRLSDSTFRCYTTAWGFCTPQASTEWAPPISGSTNGYITANAIRLWSISFPTPLSVAKITYSITVADNSANLYDLGYYTASGTLLCHTGAIAGTTFAPSVGTAKTLPFTSPCNFSPGARYYFADTGNAGTAAIALGNSSLQALAVGTPTSGATSTGGVLNLSITPPADNWTSAGVPVISLHN